MEDPEYQVFFSHAGADTWVAKQMQKHITSCGPSAFLDENDISTQFVAGTILSPTQALCLEGGEETFHCGVDARMSRTGQGGRETIVWFKLVA